MSIKVLLVEDDRSLREALGETLELAGYGYRAVGSAEEALLAVESEPFSLVISGVTCRAWTAISCWLCCAIVIRSYLCC